MYDALEDEFGDIVSKARRGQELSVTKVATDSGCSAAELTRIERYELTPPKPQVRRLAAALGLDAEKLQRSAQRAFFPADPGGRELKGLQAEMLVLGSSFKVNGYVIGCRQTGAGAIVDPGADEESIMRAVEAAGLNIEQILLTHGHHDHASALAAVCDATGAPAFVNKADLELLGDVEQVVAGSIVEGEQIAVGRQLLTAHCIPGHTPGSVCLVHEEAAFVGDIMFAGSVGGTHQQRAYHSQLDGVARHLLVLPDSVTLFPGHGPSTTVGEERRNNPFFPQT